MSTDYEPTPEQVEWMRVEVNRGVAPGTWSVDAVARFILKRQHERDAGLKYAMERAIKSLEANFDHPSWAAAYLKDALAAHARLDAPPEPTLLEAAKAILERKTQAFTCVAVDDKALAALKAAVEREERAK